MKTYPLKRCPFCGEKARLEAYDMIGTTQYVIGCGTKGCLMRKHMVYLGVTPQEIAKSWNRRKDWNS